MHKNIALVFGSGHDTKLVINAVKVAPATIKTANVALALCSSEHMAKLLTERYGVSAVKVAPLAPVRIREKLVNEGEDGFNPHLFLRDEEDVEVHLGDDLAIIDALLAFSRYYRLQLDIRLHHLVAPARQRLAALKAEGKLSGFVPVHKVAERN